MKVRPETPRVAPPTDSRSKTRDEPVRGQYVMASCGPLGPPGSRFTTSWCHRMLWGMAYTSPKTWMPMTRVSGSR